MIHTKYEPARDALIPRKIAQENPDVTPTRPTGYAPARCKPYSSSVPCHLIWLNSHAGWEETQMAFGGSKRAEIRRLTPGAWCLLYAIEENVEDGVSPMRGEVL